MRNVSEDSAIARIRVLFENYATGSKFKAPQVEFTSVRDMTGNGYEHLVDKEGNVLAVFHNGHMLSFAVPQGNLEETKSAA